MPRFCFMSSFATWSRSSRAASRLSWTVRARGLTRVEIRHRNSEREDLGTGPLGAADVHRPSPLPQESRIMKTEPVERSLRVRSPAFFFSVGSCRGHFFFEIPRDRLPAVRMKESSGGENVDCERRASRRGHLPRGGNLIYRDTCRRNDIPTPAVG
jgi:hypothetical protein